MIKNRKTLLIAALIMALGLGSVTAYAADGSSDGTPNGGDDTNYGYIIDEDNDRVIQEELEKMYANRGDTDQTNHNNTSDPSDPSNPYLTAATLPSSYPEGVTRPSDMASVSYIPAIRNQNPYGTCWAHAAIGALEINVLKQHPELKSTINLAENQLVYYSNHAGLDKYGLLTGDNYAWINNNTGHDDDNEFQAGGNEWMAIPALNSWKAGSQESGILVYNSTNNDEIIVNGLPAQYASDSSYVHVTDTKEISLPVSGGSNFSDKMTDTKNAIMKYGSVAISYYSASKYSTGYNIYAYEKPASTNHAVLFVGWDDNYSKDNFVTGPNGEKPEGDGAWIMRNSWDTWWGDSGYSYVSYYDKSIYYTGHIITGVLASEDYAHIYQYDEAGQASVPINAGQSVANIYQVQDSAQTLEAISTYIYTSNANVKVDIYTNLTDLTNPLSGTKAATVTKSTDYPGVYRIKLDEPVYMYKDTYFSVVISGANNTYVSIAVDRTFSNSAVYSGNVVNHRGESFWISSNGARDFADINGYEHTNASIKALTNDAEYVAPVLPSAITFAESRMTLDLSSSTDVKGVTLYPTVSPANTYNKALSWSSSDSDVATVDSAGIVKPVGVGTATITATSVVDPSITGTIEVSVEKKVTGVRFSTTYYYVYVGQSVTWEMEYSPAGASNCETAVWASSDESVAVVNQSGVITGVSEGTAEISVTANGFTAKKTITVEIYPVCSVNYSSKIYSLPVGGKGTVIAVANPSNASYRGIIYTSSDPSVATINSKTGEVVAKAVGITTITAASESNPEVYSSYELTVNAAPESIKLTKDPVVVSVDSSTYIPVNVTPSSAASYVRWETTDPTIAMVSGYYIVGVSEGTCTLIGTSIVDPTMKVTGTIMVGDYIRSLYISSAYTTVNVGSSRQWTAGYSPSNATNADQIVWSSSDESVATVDQTGLVTGISAGEATITVSVGYISSSYKVTIKGYDVSITGIKYTSATGVIPVGGTYKFAAQVLPSNANNKKVLYSSSDTSVATVDEDGTVHALKAGKITITATAAGNPSYFTRVNVKTVDDENNTFIYYIDGANGWKTVGGVEYWYENGFRQGVKLNADGTIDYSYRGKEINSLAITGEDAWYWLDNDAKGKKAVSKDVYQESEAGDWGEKEIVKDGKTVRVGKWVRYDAQGHMIKGWCAGSGTTARVVSGPYDSAIKAGESVYYFDKVYGTMAKGKVRIDGKWYEFNTATGVLIGEVRGTSLYDTYNDTTKKGWKIENGTPYWYEDGVKQGVKYKADGSLDLSYRGKEIFDGTTNAWYWLDCVLGGTIATSKDVYQESLADDAGNYGKWVRYDADGHMIKGWCAGSGETARVVSGPYDGGIAAGESVYYFDPVYGTMYKGWRKIDGVDYYFNEVTGVLAR